MQNFYEYQLKGQKDIGLYLRGGKGQVKLESPSGKFYLYSFRYPSDASSFPEGTMFVSSKYPGSPWMYTGMLTPDNRFIHTRKSQVEVDSEQFKGAKYLVRMMTQEFDSPMKVYHNCVCSVCGRSLSFNYSLVHGMGYRCRNNLMRRLHAKSEQVLGK